MGPREGGSAAVHGEPSGECKDEEDGERKEVSESLAEDPENLAVVSASLAEACESLSGASVCLAGASENLIGAFESQAWTSDSRMTSSFQQGPGQINRTLTPGPQQALGPISMTHVASVGPRFHQLKPGS